MQAFSLSGMDFRHQGTGQFHQVKAQDYCWYFEAEQSDGRSKSTYVGFNISNCILNLHFKTNFGALYISRCEGEKNVWEKNKISQLPLIRTFHTETNYPNGNLQVVLTFPCLNLEQRLRTSNKSSRHPFPKWSAWKNVTFIAKLKEDVLQWRTLEWQL